MDMKRRHIVLAGMAGGFGWLEAARAAAPAAPAFDMVKLSVGFPPGGVTDIVARLMADQLRVGNYAKNVVVENRSGANGRLVVETLKSATADGSMIALAPNSSFTINPHIYRSLGYVPFQDVIPVATVATYESALAVGPLVPTNVRDLRSFFEWCRRHPQSASFGTPGIGTSLHLLIASLFKAANVEVSHIPFRGSVPAVTDLLGGHIASVTLPIGDFRQHLQDGKLRLLGTSGPVRSRFAPDVPTYLEQGFKDAVVRDGWSIALPGKASTAVIQSLVQACHAALASPDYTQALEASALTPATALSYEDTVKELKAQSQRWAERVTATGITIDS